MTKNEALKLAQEWQSKDWNSESPMSADFAISEANDAINALMQALAAPVQEPAEKFCDANCTWSDHHPDCKFAQPAPVQEPVAWEQFYPDIGKSQMEKNT
jgi:hypothetical protein